jgi:uncharacterized protein
VSAGPLRDLLTFLLGVLTGMLSGLFGVGGGVVAQPGLRALGAAPLEAVGSTLPMILPGALSGTIRYQRERLVDWRIVRLTAPVGVVTAVGGALLADHVPGGGHLLLILTALLLCYNAWRMGRGSAAPEGAEDEAPGRRDSPLAFAVVGLVAGGLSGLLGIGGGVLMVPAFTEVLRIPLKRAIATSLACVGIFAVPSMISHALLGDIDWRFALWLTAGIVPGAQLGVRITIRTAERKMRLATAICLGAVAAIYALSELPQLFRELR